MNFSSLGLSNEIASAVLEQGYSEPTPIQSQAIPVILKGRDVMAAAQTGTGKTAGFVLPILQRLSTNKPNNKEHQLRALIITPTRELAAQVYESVENYGNNVNLRGAAVFGGVKINPQIKRLRAGVDILVATPGRLLDLYQQNAVDLSAVQCVVLDEADRMLDMGFIGDIQKILNQLPKNRQTLLFSATFSEEVKKFSKGIVNDPTVISVSPPNSTVDRITQSIIPVDKDRKSDLLIHLIKSNNWQQVLVFARTRRGADRLCKRLIKDGIRAAAIHGDKAQGARTRALQQFKDWDIQVLVATDIAARGLDIQQLPHVINFDLPNSPEDYVHRIGRTGRAGEEGEAISLVSSDESQQLFDIERFIKTTLTRHDIDGFEITHQLANPKTASKPASKKSGRRRPRNRSNSGSSANAGNPQNQRSGKPSGNSAGKPPGKSSGKPSKKFRGKSSGKFAGKGAGKPAGQSAGQSSGKSRRRKPAGQKNA